MKLHKHFGDLPEFHNAIVTIGSFDGVHAGHQEILKKLHKLAKERGGESVIITFHPHPRLVLFPDDKSLKLITTVEEKAELISRFGIDHLVVVPFTKSFANQDSTTYIKEFLVEKFNPKLIVIGYDHKFGKNRAGDIRLLKEYSSQFNYEIEEIPEQMIQEMAVSSSRIRKALEKGDIRKANQLLGHHFSLTGTVIKGKRKGSAIGFPTANLSLPDADKVIPPDGVYAVFIDFENNRYEGMLYIGKSMSNDNRSIEVNIFDFDENIYNKKLNVSIKARIRGDMRFEELDDLKIQLGLDKEKTIFLLRESTEEAGNGA